MIKYLPTQLLVKSKFSGQATLLAILIATAVAVITAVGVTSRQTSSLRRSTYTAQTDQAFSCANSAVDVALLCISDSEQNSTDPVTCSATNTTLTGSNCTYTYTVAAINDATINISTLPKDSVQQFNTSNATGVSIRWRRASSQSIIPQPAIELTYAYQTASDYSMDKAAWTHGSSVPSGVTVEGFVSSGAPDGSGYVTVTYNFPGGASSNSLVRIKPLFSDAEVRVTLNGGATPTQGYRIISSGVAGGTVRNIEVLRMNPQLPAIFDYVLYSEEGSINK